MTIEEMKRKKQELGYSNKLLSELSGVPVPTIQKIFSGGTRSPRRETLIKLHTALYGKRSSSLCSYLPHMQKQYSSIAAEALPAYNAKKKGGYTLADYLALPDEERVELIDGVFYDMTAPSTVHQAIGGFLHKQLLDFVLAHKGPCMPLMSPVDVQLDEDDRTVVQPDVLIVCDRKKFQNGRVFGAPDFLVEVLSPSTRNKDMQLKHFKYANAGVREYWMIDPERRCCVVYDLEHQDLPKIYGPEDKVPVLIWDGKCEVDFSTIYPYIEFLYPAK